MGRYHRENALCSCTRQGLLPGRLWRTPGDFGRVCLHPDRSGFLGPGVRPGFCTRSLQQSDKPALLDQQQNQWSNLSQIIEFTDDIGKKDKIDIEYIFTLI